LEPLASVIAGLIEEFEQIANITFTVSDNLVLIKNSYGHLLWHLTVVKKDDVSERNLAKHIIDDFTKFVSGFLPNVALTSISEIRDRTFEYLFQFNSELDFAAISHLYALKCSELGFPTAEIDFRNYLARLFASNIESGLANSNRFTEVTSKSSVIKFLNQFDTLSANIGGLDNTNANSKAAIIKVLKSTTKQRFDENVQTAFGTNRKTHERFKKGKKPVFLNSSSDSANQELAVLDVFEPQIISTAFRPALRYGAIICDRRDKDKEFFVCVQPLCDSVRLKAGEYHKFPFLKLEPAKNTGKFLVVLEIDGSYRNFSCKMKPNNIQTFRFKSKASSLDIRGNKLPNKNEFVFSNSKNRKFRWIGNLKEVYTQEIVNTLASEGSRVGSTKFEWLRFNSNKE